MTSSLAVRLGIDSRAGGLLVARRISDKNSDELIEIESVRSVSEIGADSQSRVTIAVPDREVMVKSLQMRPDAAIDLIQRLHFELATSLLEPEETFLFDVVPSFRADRFLGLIYRRERLSSLASLVLSDLFDKVPKPDFRARAVALGMGYLGYVRSEVKGLVALAELSEDGVALCFLYGPSIVAVGRMNLQPYAPDDARWLRTFGSDLKTLVNFKLSELAGIGLSLPLSSLVICGRNSIPQVIDSLAPLFSAPLTHPVIDRNRVRTAGPEGEVDLADSLVALGLTVN